MGGHLASAMKRNPNLKVMVNGGYYDLATPYYEGWYEMLHLHIPPSLLKNISFHYYLSGHMVCAHEQSLKEIHDAVAGFIRRPTMSRNRNGSRIASLNKKLTQSHRAAETAFLKQMTRIVAN